MFEWGRSEAFTHWFNAYFSIKQALRQEWAGQAFLAACAILDILAQYSRNTESETESFFSIFPIIFICKNKKSQATSRKSLDEGLRTIQQNSKQALKNA